MWYDPITLLSNLPLELILAILPHLTPRDVISLRLVDKAHNRLFSSDMVCRAGVKLFFGDAWETCIGNGNRRAPGKETFDRIYLCRERFRTSRPTRFSTILAGGRRKCAKLSRHDGILSVVLRRGPPKLQLFDLYSPQYSDKGTLIPSVEVPLVGLECGNNDDDKDSGDSRPLLDMNSPLVEWIPQPRQRQRWGGRMPASAVPSSRSQTRHPAMAFDFIPVSPLLATNDGILLIAAQFNEMCWKVTPASPRFLSETMPTAFATFSIKRDESFGMALQTWVSHDALHDPEWNYYDCPTAAVNQHYAVWRVQDWRGFQTPADHTSLEIVKILPMQVRRHSVGVTNNSPLRLSDEEYQTHVTHFHVDIPYSEVPPAVNCRTIGVDKNGKLVFYAAGGRGIDTIVVFVYGIQWQAHGEDSTELRRITDVTMVAKFRLGGVGILHLMEDPEPDGGEGSLTRHQQSLHFEESLVPHQQVNKTVNSGDHIFLVLRAQLHDIPRGSAFKVESCIVWCIPITQTKRGLDPDWTEQGTRVPILSTDQSALEVTQEWEYPSSFQPPTIFLALNPAGSTGSLNYIPFNPSSPHAVPYDDELIPQLPAYHRHQFQCPLPLPLPSVTYGSVGEAHTGAFILPYILPRYPASSYNPPENQNHSDSVDRIYIPAFNGTYARYGVEEGVDVVVNSWFVELKLESEYTTRTHPQSGLLGEEQDVEKRFSLSEFKTVSVLGVGDGWVVWQCRSDNEDAFCIMRFD